jgi:hypothetical protein
MRNLPVQAIRQGQLQCTGDKHKGISFTGNFHGASTLYTPGLFAMLQKAMKAMKT